MLIYLICYSIKSMLLCEVYVSNLLVRLICEVYVSNLLVRLICKLYLLMISCSLFIEIVNLVNI